MAGSGIRKITPHVRNVLAVLLAAHERGEALHGFAVAQLSGETTGAVYPMLKRLECDGYAEAEWEIPPGRSPRRLYWLTPIGVVFAGAHGRVEPA